MATLGVYAIFIWFFKIRNGLSLCEALDILMNDDMGGEVFIQLPHPHVDTDADSGEENGSRWASNFFPFLFIITLFVY